MDTEKIMLMLDEISGGIKGLTADVGNLTVDVKNLTVRMDNLEERTTVLEKNQDGFMMVLKQLVDQVADSQAALRHEMLEGFRQIEINLENSYDGRIKANFEGMTATDEKLRIEVTTREKLAEKVEEHDVRLLVLEKKAS